MTDLNTQRDGGAKGFHRKELANREMANLLARLSWSIKVLKLQLLILGCTSLE
jgi:hypothetical protein